MEFETVKEAAARRNVSSRTIQRWAKEGKLHGAFLRNGVWFIPKKTVLPSAVVLSPVLCGEEKLIPGEEEPVRFPLPLLRGMFSLGESQDYINHIADSDDRNIALAEYYYYIGEMNQVISITEQYLDHEDASLRYSAGILTIFASIFTGHIHLAKVILIRVFDELMEGLWQNASLKLHALEILVARIGGIILDLPVPQTPPLEAYLCYLPNGIRLYGCYLLAYEAYLQKKYDRAVAICDTAMAMCNHPYPVANIYTLLIGSASLMKLKRVKEAKEYFAQGWEIAQKDGFIIPFSFHYNILGGLTEVLLRHDFPEVYKQIIAKNKELQKGLHRFAEKGDTDCVYMLTPIETTICLLYTQDWQAKEIALHLDFSERTVKNYIRYIFEKLGVSKKSELKAYMRK